MHPRKERAGFTRSLSVRTSDERTARGWTTRGDLIDTLVWSSHDAGIREPVRRTPSHCCAAPSATPPPGGPPAQEKSPANSPTAQEKSPASSWLATAAEQL